MTPLELVARTTAAKYGLDEALVCAIIEQESGWNPWAMRYEPGFFGKYVAPLYAANKIKSATEAYARAFSWGLMQVMGQVAIENGFLGLFLSQLCDPAMGVDVGCRVFKAKLDRANGNTEAALQLWNGGGNLAYSSQVLARVPKYNQDNSADVQAAAAGDL